MDMVINKCDWMCYGTKSVECAGELVATQNCSDFLFNTHLQEIYYNV